MVNPIMKDLFDMVPVYGEHKTELDNLKKVVDKENKNIKKLMQDLDIEDCDSNGWRVKYGTQKRRSINEEMLLTILLENWYKQCDDLGIIELKPTINYEALETALYKGLIDNAMVLDINRAREVKIVNTLKVSKIKQKEEIE